MPDDMLNGYGGKHSNAPTIDLKAALEPAALAAWVEYEMAGHVANQAALLARHERFLAVTADGIGDDIMLGHAADFAKDLANEKKAIAEHHDRIKAPVLFAGRLIDSAAKTITDTLGLAASQVGARTTDYLRRKEAIRLAEAEAEAARLAAEAEAKIEAAQRSGDAATQEAAIAAIDAAQQASAPAAFSPLELTRTRSAGGSLTGLKANWTYSVVDVAKMPAHLMCVNDAAVRLAIRQGVREVPGLRIWNDSKAMVR